MIRSELGGEPDQVFPRFDPQPLAAASLGQVHAARTKGGQEVAVRSSTPASQPLCAMI